MLSSIRDFFSWETNYPKMYASIWQEGLKILEKKKKIEIHFTQKDIEKIILDEKSNLSEIEKITELLEVKILKIAKEPSWWRKNKTIYISSAVTIWFSEILSLILISRIHDMDNWAVHRYTLRTMWNGVEASHTDRISHIIFKILTGTWEENNNQEITNTLNKETRNHHNVWKCPFMEAKNRDDRIQSIIRIVNEKLSISFADDVNIQDIPKALQILAENFPKK